MDRKFIGLTVAIVLVLSAFSKIALSEKYFSSTYEHSPGDRYTISFWNTRWEHIDNRLDALEDEGSNIFGTVSISGNVAGDTSIDAESSTDTLTLVGGSNVMLTGSEGSDSIQIDVSTTPLTIENNDATVALPTTLDFDANFSLSESPTNEVNISLANALANVYSLGLSGYLDLDAVSDPENPPAGSVRLFGQSDEIYLLDSSGTKTNLLTGASNEAIQDVAWGGTILGGTQTLISVTYQDGTDDVDFVVNSDLGDAGWNWSNVVDADITDTLTASIFAGSGSTTNAVDLATAEVSGILPGSNVQDVFLHNNANDVTSGNIQLYDGVGDSPSLDLTDASGESMELAKIDGGVAAIYNDSGIIGLLPNGDIDDYLSISTTANVPKISTVGASNLIISPSSGVIDLDGCSVIGLSSVATDDNLTLFDGIGDSPYIELQDADTNYLRIQKYDVGGAALVNNEGSIQMRASGDVDDYLLFETNGNIPILRATATSAYFQIGAAATPYISFVTDGAGDAEIVLPNDSIGPAELDSTTGAYDFGGVTSLEIPNAEGDATLTAAGQIAGDGADDAIAYHFGSGGEIAGEAQISALHAVSVSFDPGSFYDLETRYRLFSIGDEAPNGITIVEWKVDFGMDPDVEADLNLCYADDWAGTNETVIDALDTTDGTASEDTNANINGGAAVANGKYLYLLFDADPEGTGDYLTVEFWYYAEED